LSSSPFVLDMKMMAHNCYLHVFFFRPIFSLLWKKKHDDHMWLLLSWPLVLIHFKHEDYVNHTNCRRFCLICSLLSDTKKTTHNHWIHVFFSLPIINLIKNRRQPYPCHLLPTTFIGAPLIGRTMHIYVFCHLIKVENSINNVYICLLMCCWSFVNVGPFKKLVFVLLDFERTCFVLSWFFFTSMWLFIKVFVWICRIAMGGKGN
jgi:hypothetical protein